ncbi:MAG: PIN domain-containing protein [Holophagaceae bacterium]|nr:PIN domain-containing protein [Holophagaceae bacterium]
MPIKVNYDMALQFIFEARRLKASYGLSLGDSFALAEAKSSDGTLVTSDNDFREAEKAGIAAIFWIND